MKAVNLSNKQTEASVPALSSTGTAVGWRNPNSGRLIGFVGFTTLLAILFGRPFASLVTHVIESDLHSYILLVPFISAYLVYVRRDQLPKVYRSSLQWALLPLIAGLGSLAAALRLRSSSSQNDDLALMALSFLCFFATGGFLFLGRDWMKAATFPNAFALFIIPLPDQAVYYMETGSKLASAEAANLFFNLTTMPVFRDGTIFQLPGIVIAVAQECSGIHSSWVLFIASILAANLFLRSPWRRIVLVTLVIPLGILRNGFRIFVIGYLCVHYGPAMIHSAIHRRGGPLFFGLALIPLFLILLWLRKGEASNRHQTG